MISFPAGNMQLKCPRPEPEVTIFLIYVTYVIPQHDNTKIPTDAAERKNWNKYKLQLYIKLILPVCGETPPPSSLSGFCFSSPDNFNS